MKNRIWFSLAALLVISGTLLLVQQPSQADRQTPYERLSSASSPVFLPAVSEWYVISKKTAQPPTEADCFGAGIRCFAPQAMHAAYNYGPLFAQGFDGTGKTIAVIDSFGSATIATDLNVFDTAFGLPHLCGETGVTCVPGMPTFNVLHVQGAPPPNPPPPNNGTGQENHNLWAVEVTLDVEWAHATAPGANILLVVTPTAETLGVQGFPTMMNALKYVVDNHLADVVSMSFAAGEGSFKNGLASISHLRKAFEDAQANGVTLFAASGDGGTTNILKEPVKNPRVIPYPSVEWPASDPLVTGVGGTYLCADPNQTSMRVDDDTDPPAKCQAFPGQTEIGWTFAGGGYSILFPRPAFQDNLPPGSSYIGSSVGAPGPNSNMRGVPDVAYQASGGTGPLIYFDGQWGSVGGTSCSSPQWAGLIAIADQISGSDLGYINPALYKIGSDSTRYASDFFDITTGANQTSSIPGYPASTGWDAVTGLGTPNAANLAPDLVSAVKGH
jgi:subtilase family serine protease